MIRIRKELKAVQLNLQLTEDERQLAQARGLTFRTRARNRLVCNQAKRLGVLTIKQAHSLHGQVWPRASKSKTPSTTEKPRKEVVVRVMKRATISSSGTGFCPNCSAYRSVIYEGHNTCSFCGETYIGERSEGERRYGYY